MKSEATIVGVSGFSSNVGKTTMVCELLRRLPGWEAIKVTRGHYRSCGREPDVCCVSALLSDEPVVRSGREANYESGKDTGRFWESGAANVHWVIVQEHQVERGINEALARVQSMGVIIEGNSFLDYVNADLAIMCARAEGGKVKPSARRALLKSDLLYLSSLEQDGFKEADQFEKWRSNLPIDLNLNGLPIFTIADLPRLTSCISQWGKLVRANLCSSNAAIGAARQHS